MNVGFVGWFPDRAPQVFERAKPVLLAIGPKVTRIGGNGLACQMKITINLLLMVGAICFGEAIALAEKGGVARELAVDATGMSATGGS